MNRHIGKCELRHGLSGGAVASDHAAFLSARAVRLSSDLSVRILAVFLMIILSFLPGAHARAADVETKVIKANNNFSVSAEYGLDGFAVYDNPMQVRVTVESRENFTGILQLVPHSDYGQVVPASGKRITLAAGEAKTFTLSTTALGGEGNMMLSLADERDKLVYQQNDIFQLANIGQYAVVGVLSDDYSGLNYINGTSVSIGSFLGTATTLELTAESFPEDEQILKLLNYIVIDNYDTSTLTEKQYRALKQWVNGGGVLILCLGSHYQNVLAGFQDDFVSGTLGALNKKRLLWDTGMEDLSLDQVECVDFELNEGEELSVYAKDQTAYTKQYGVGRVVVLGYSLSMEPLVSYVRKANVASMLLTSAYTDTLRTTLEQGGYDQVFDGAMNLASVSENTKKPSALLYGLLLTFYVALVGPFLYLILKKMGKREKIWIAVPLVSLAFTGIIYCTSFLYRINKPLLNTFSLITLSGDSAKEQVFTEVVCPSAKNYTLALSEDYGGFQCNTRDYSYSFFSSGESDQGAYDYMFLDNGTGYEVVLNSRQAFDSFKFAAGKVLDHAGQFGENLNCTTTGFTGTVTNNTAYDLSGVVVTYEDHFYYIGELKQGETAAIDPANVVDASYDTINTNYGRQYPSEIYDKLYSVNNMMENNVVNINDFMQGYIWGTVVNYGTGLMDEGAVKSSGMAVLLQSFRKQYSDVTTSYYPNIMPMVVDSQGDYDQDNGTMYGTECTLTYSFEGYGDIETLTLAGESEDGEYGRSADVYAFNMENGDYEQIFVDSDVLTGKELEKYMSHNIIQLRFRQPDYDAFSNTYYNYYIPRITAEGGLN